LVVQRPGAARLRREAELKGAPLGGELDFQRRQKICW
jgi:hypothetical protein